MNIQELLKTIDPTALSNESATAIAEAFKSAVEERVKIETGISDGINIEVLKGLSGNEKIKGKEAVEEVKTNE